MLTEVLCATILVITLTWWLSRRIQRDELMDCIPGSRDDLIKGMDPYKTHLNFHTISKKYGPIACFMFPEKSILLSSFDLLHKVLVTDGKVFGGRKNGFREQNIWANSGIVFSPKPNADWKKLRQISQKHLRQFGEGLTQLESAINKVAEQMFEDISENSNKPRDPYKIIFNTALNTIAYLICGTHKGSKEPIIQKMKEYENLVVLTVSIYAPRQFLLMERFPWLRYLGIGKWDKYQRLETLHNEIWHQVKELKRKYPEARTMVQVLTDHLRDNGGTLTEREAQSTALTVIIAGVITTSTTFYAAINILAHHEDIQRKLYEEIIQTKHIYGNITLNEKQNMPYMRAFIYELLRFTTILPTLVPHMTTETTELNGYKIPAGTRILPNAWTLHHDEDFWEKPYDFVPARFLDDEGEVVPADHPNRTHLMPFGAGTRVCLGESLAMARLFIWTVNLVEQFKVVPAPGNNKSTTDPRLANCEAVIRPQPYQVIFEKRN